MLILYAFTYFTFTFFHNSLPDDDGDDNDDDGPYHTGSVCSYCELCEVRLKLKDRNVVIKPLNKSLKTQTVANDSSDN